MCEARFPFRHARWEHNFTARALRTCCYIVALSFKPWPLVRKRFLRKRNAQVEVGRGDYHTRQAKRLALNNELSSASFPTSRCWQLRKKQGGSSQTLSWLLRVPLSIIKKDLESIGLRMSLLFEEFICLKAAVLANRVTTNNRIVTGRRIVIPRLIYVRFYSQLLVPCTLIGHDRALI